jgi:hypothetical protein
MRRRLLALAAFAAVLLASEADARAPLRWPQPRLEQPRVVRLGTGMTVTDMDPKRDYIVKLPHAVKRGATVLKGGRNVVLVGGEIEIPRRAKGSTERRAIYVKDNAGTVHIEGVLIRGRGVGDGIAIAAPRSTVQVQNSRIVDLRGSYAGWHADVLQPWGGVRSLRIDRLTGSSNYQGLQIPRDLGRIGAADIRNVDLSYTNRRPATGGYLLWLATGADSCRGYPVRLRRVYLAPKRGRSLADSVWPPATFDRGCAARRAGSGIGWRRLPVAGRVRPGPPRGGHLVPAGTAGLDYTTPGYRGVAGPVVQR